MASKKKGVLPVDILKPDARNRYVQRVTGGAEEKPYTGLLAEPWPTLPWRLGDGNSVPWWAEGQISADDWRRAVERIQTIDTQRFVKCWELLFQHFDVDMEADDAAQQLTFAVAVKHVPAFQSFASFERLSSRRSSSSKKGARTKLDPAGTAMLLAEAQEFRERFRDDEGKWPSKRQIATHLCTLPLCKDRKLKFETVRDLLGQVKTAKAKYVEGVATEFQRQFIEVVVPFVREEIPQQ